MLIIPTIQILGHVAKNFLTERKSPRLKAFFKKSFVLYHLVSAKTEEK